MKIMPATPKVVSRNIRSEAQLMCYCEACGTMDLHGAQCTTCGFDFEMPAEPMRWRMPEEEPFGTAGTAA